MFNNFIDRRFFTRNLLFLFLVSIAYGCTTQRNIVKDDQPPVQKVQVVTRNATGSIWPGATMNNTLFADKKARREGDIVTIIIEESSQAGNEAATNTGRTTNTSAGINALLGLDTSLLERNANMGGSISIGGSSSNSLKGAGDTTRGGTMEARITAKVTRVLSNGNMMIEGRRQLTVNAEDQYIIISGTIRPEDITSDNLIASQYIADARIVYTGSGVINDKMRPGWLTRIADWVWPF
ncbi:MAG: flagellar basal body L-ring protein FlgH [Deltaproteobacteria bacterium]|nr:flagellar basal body L-ring protein FlgH [Deltaproteobacteria bacterium]